MSRRMRASDSAAAADGFFGVRAGRAVALRVCASAERGADAWQYFDSRAEWAADVRDDEDIFAEPCDGGGDPVGDAGDFAA